MAARRALLTVALALGALLVLAACGEETPEGPGGSPPAPTTSEANGVVFARGQVEITGRGRSRIIQVEIAETDEQRSRGLMFRTSLPPDQGMVFLFPEDVSGGFWMKDTLVPLSIAFYDAEGRIIEILDMEPCRADPCPSYGPGAPYRGALEVNRGAFARWGVEPGDVVRLSR